MPLSKNLSSHVRLSENVDMNRVAPNQLLTIRETRNLKGYFKFRKNHYFSTKICRTCFVLSCLDEIISEITIQRWK